MLSPDGTGALVGLADRNPARGFPPMRVTIPLWKERSPVRSGQLCHPAVRTDPSARLTARDRHRPRHFASAALDESALSRLPAFAGGPSRDPSGPRPLAADRGSPQALPVSQGSAAQMAMLALPAMR